MIIYVENSRDYTHTPTDTQLLEVNSIKLQGTKSTRKVQFPFYTLKVKHPNIKLRKQLHLQSISKNKILRGKLNQGGRHMY